MTDLRATPLRRLCGGVLVAVVLAAALPSVAAEPGAQSILTYHGAPDRSGNFVVPVLTFERARALRLDEDFRAQVSGHVYAQPLYWQPSGSGSAMLIVATEDDVVHALDAVTGSEIWKRALGKPVPRSALGCGNINPLGITGTPVIDASRESVYLDAAVETASGPRHLVFGLSLKDGASLSGWPLDVAEALGKQQREFIPRDQNQRGALAILDGTVYVPFGGHFGDCGNYRGTVVGISLADPQRVMSFVTRARGGGIWAPGGIASDSKSLFVTTGNTFGASTFSDGEAVLRLAPDLHRPESTRDYFAPSDWRALDASDTDLGGTGPLPLDVPSASGSQALILALGKDRKAYLLDRNNLGGIGHPLAVEVVARGSIRTAPAAYPAPDGVFVAFQEAGAHCPSGTGLGADLTVLKITPGAPPVIATAWCGAVRGGGSPIVTTTDGRANPIVWMLGAEGDNRLHGFRGDTGEPLFTSAPLTGLRHFQTLIATADRLYVAADGRVYAFHF